MVLILVTTILVTWLKPDPENRFATFRSRMVRTALRGYSMDITTQDPAVIRSFLTKKQAHGDWRGPARLDDWPVLGCAVLTWRSHPAAMICYGSGQPELWLFVVDSGALPDPPTKAGGQFTRVNRLNTTSWSEAGKTYVLAGAMAEGELRKLLNDAG